MTAAAGIASAQNPGDPLFCQPNEGNTFLIVNGGTGIFTVDPDCYNNNIGNPPSNTPPGPTITTSQGGTLTLHLAPSGGNYTYTPPTPDFTGLDTFQIGVTTTWNATGGTGSHGGTFLGRPGGADTETVTLNVLPATFGMSVAGAAKLVPIPAGSVTGCGPQGNAGQGPSTGTVAGCTTATGLGQYRTPTSITTAHGTVTNSGNTLRYTPAAGYTGPDTFTFHTFGVNTDGQYALDSGAMTMNVTVNPPIVISPAPSLPNGSVGIAYPTQTLSATGGFPGYTFSITAGALPPGLTLSGTTISGTPTASGTYNFTVQVTDSASNSVTQAYSITVPAAPVPTLGPWALALLCGLLIAIGTRMLVPRGV